jgi:hypothetical protein
MLKKWVSLGKFNWKIYHIIIIFAVFICSSFGPSSRKRNVHVNGKHETGEDLALKKHLKEDVDF